MVDPAVGGSATSFLPPGSRYFGCRCCNDLTYMSCWESHRYGRLFGRLARKSGIDEYPREGSVLPRQDIGSLSQPLSYGSARDGLQGACRWAGLAPVEA